jgi:hypothetical protein
MGATYALRGGQPFQDCSDRIGGTAAAAWGRPRSRGEDGTRAGAGGALGRIGSGTTKATEPPRPCSQTDEPGPGIAEPSAMSGWTGLARGL